MQHRLLRAGSCAVVGEQRAHQHQVADGLRHLRPADLHGADVHPRPGERRHAGHRLGQGRLVGMMGEAQIGTAGVQVQRRSVRRQRHRRALRVPARSAESPRARPTGLARGVRGDGAVDVRTGALDLHAGGADLRFPHHAYEAALAEAVTGVTPFARAWMHVGTVQVGGTKMAKSVGNLVLVRTLLTDHSAAAVRLLLLNRQWSQPWDYAPELLAAAEARLEDLHAAAGRPGEAAGAEQAVLHALLADLDVPTAIDIAVEAGGRAARTVVQVLGVA